MKIIGKGKPVTDEQGKITEDVIIVEMTETEALQVTGVAGKPVISGRFKPGREVNIAEVYKKVEKINTNQTELIAAAESMIASATVIKNNSVLTDEA